MKIIDLINENSEIQIPEKLNGYYNYLKKQSTKVKVDELDGDLIFLVLKDNTPTNNHIEVNIEYPELDINKVATIGKAILKKVGDNYLHGDDWKTTLSVSKKFRRKGLASMIYDFAEHETGRTVIPANTLTKAAKKFWINRLENKGLDSDQFFNM